MRRGVSRRELISATHGSKMVSMNITLKNVPDSVYRTIKREGKTKGRSLNAQVMQILTAEAAHAARLRKLAKFAASTRAAYSVR